MKQLEFDVFFDYIFVIKISLRASTYVYCERLPIDLKMSSNRQMAPPSIGSRPLCGVIVSLSDCSSDFLLLSNTCLRKKKKASVDGGSR